MSEKPPSQSQSFTNSTVSGQVAIAGHNVVQNANQTQETEKQLTVDEVVNLLKQIETIVKKSNLPKQVQEEAEPYLGITKIEVQKKDSNRGLAAGNFKRFIEILKTTGQTFKEVKKVLQPIVPDLTSWFGVATNFFEL